jgi:CBS domain-containing protein
MEVMMSTDIGHLPVVDATGALVGVVSNADLIRRFFMAGETAEVESTVRVADRRGVGASLGAGFHEDAQGAGTVAEVMSTRVRTVTDSASLAEAVQSMSRFRVHGLPVITEAHALVGFISTFDVVDWVAIG